MGEMPKSRPMTDDEREITFPVPICPDAVAGKPHDEHRIDGTWREWCPGVQQETLTERLDRNAVVSKGCAAGDSCTGATFPGHPAHVVKDDAYWAKLADDARPHLQRIRAEDRPDAETDHEHAMRGCAERIAHRAQYDALVLVDELSRGLHDASGVLSEAAEKLGIAEQWKARGR